MYLLLDKYFVLQYLTQRRRMDSAEEVVKPDCGDYCGSLVSSCCLLLVEIRPTLSLIWIISVKFSPLSCPATPLPSPPPYSRMVSSENKIGNVLRRRRGGRGSGRMRGCCPGWGRDTRVHHGPPLQCRFSPLKWRQYRYFSATAGPATSLRLSVLQRSRCQKCSTIPGLSLTFLSPALRSSLTCELSRILSSQQKGQIFKSLPARTRLDPWGLLFTLSRDGCSLNNLLTKLRSTDANILLVIEVSQPPSYTLDKRETIELNQNINISFIWRNSPRDVQNVINKERKCHAMSSGDGMHFIFRISTEMFSVPFCQIQTFYCGSTRGAQRLSSSASAPPSENIIAQVGNTQRPNRRYLRLKDTSCQ